MTRQYEPSLKFTPQPSCDGCGMRIVLVGPPGSGKGTQAKRLTEHLGLRYIGTGELLRDAIRHGTTEGKAVEPLIKAGQLVPDEMVNGLVSELFEGNPPSRFVFDGYPRTLSQAVWFDRFLHTLDLDIDNVLQFAISDTEVVRRISGRRICPDCGTPYHIQDNPPKVAGICDKDGVPLIQRDDDREDVILARLKVFHDNTDALVEHYKNKGVLREIPTQQSVETIYQTILTLLKD